MVTTPHQPEKVYTATEVGTLLESIRSELRVLADGLKSLLEWKEQVDARLARIEERLILVEDTVRVAIPDLYRRVKRLETHCGFN